MTGAAVAFMVLSVLAVGGGLVAVASTSLFRSALGLMVSLVGVAGLYLLQHAEFLAVVQILVYVGGVTVLIIFAILLVERGNVMRVQLNRLAGIGAVIGAALGAGVGLLVWRSVSLPSAPPARLVADDIGKAFVNQYLVPFEAVSILLLIALVGALVIARE